MTPKISLITATVGAALAFAAPAFGDNWGGDRQDQPGRVSPDLVDLLAAKNGTVDNTGVHGRKQATGASYPDWFERAAIAAISRESAVAPSIVSERTPDPQWMTALRLRSEGLNRIHGLGEFATSSGSGYKDAFERTVEPQSLKAERARSEGLNRIYGLGEYALDGYRDAHERAVPPTASTPVSVTASGRELEWPQIGIGFGIGMVLVLGLFLAMKTTRQRPLAH